MKKNYLSPELCELYEYKDILSESTGQDAGWDENWGEPKVLETGGKL